MSKWVVCTNQAYYPDVTEFDTYDEAKEAYEKDLVYSKGSNAEVYLCEVKEHQVFREVT